MWDWLMGLVEQLNPLMLIGAGVLLFLASKAGVTLPASLKLAIFNALVKLLGKLLGIDPNVPTPPVPDHGPPVISPTHTCVTAWECLHEHLGEPAQKPLAEVWALIPGGAK